MVALISTPWHLQYRLHKHTFTQYIEYMENIEYMLSLEYIESIECLLSFEYLENDN